MKDNEWLSYAFEAFGIAVLMRDYELAKDIIADTFDAGFDQAARSMSWYLRHHHDRQNALKNYA